jgi:hypothetical protein
MILKRILAVTMMIIGVSFIFVSAMAFINNQIDTAIFFGLAAAACIVSGSLLFSKKKSIKDFFDDLTSFMP